MPTSGVQQAVDDGGAGLPDVGDVGCQDLEQGFLLWWGRLNLPCGLPSRLTQEWVSAHVRIDLGLCMRAAH